ncbi:hypothetical protein BG015_009230 [Linnemannia schmuckeri]|uniref:FAD-binding PCMH-type domain-containing protein n=1 Tax=Linnemannia schmuckeri TaxID=64567 RepID=A0A9P5V9Z4_9FUNG|nr:hypothetical protein BG015_009230 [Linnemannia schmuckeri]
MVASAFEGFYGKVVQRGDEAYEESVYQYAWSSHVDEGIIEPEAILYAKDDADVIAAINYAKSHDIAVAVRTGGHQYSGASSTNGRNIQLDLSSTYTDFHWDNADHSQVTLGISIDLGRFQKKLGEQGRFVPMGVCRQVYLGGHIQTGGYGQLIRSFGLLADYVQKVRIITADGQARWVQRGKAQDKDLLYAILGGSPGNFGVITNVTLNVLKDEDYADSRGFRALFLYSEATLKRLLDVMVELDDSPDTPGDYDYSLSMMSALPSEGRPAVIVAFAHWANLEGQNQPYNPEFFEKILKAGGKPMPYLGTFLDGKTHTPMSELCSHWLLPVARVFPFPYRKHTNLSNSNSEALKKSCWTEWVSARIQELEADPSNGCFMGAQFLYSGGAHSRFIRNAKDGVTSLSWRDSSFMATLSVSYNNMESADAEKTANAWVQKSDFEGVGHPEARFSAQDRRILWASYDLDLPAARKYYFDQEPGKYDRLSGIKKMYDPSHVFTANKFCIGPLPTHVLDADKTCGPNTMDNNLLTVLCLGDGKATSQAFPVEIEATKTIGNLKQRIKTENPNMFIGVNAKDLVFWLHAPALVLAPTPHSAHAGDALRSVSPYHPTVDPKDVEGSQKERLGSFSKRTLLYGQTAKDIKLVMLGLELDKQAKASDGKMTLRSIVDDLNFAQLAIDVEEMHATIVRKQGVAHNLLDIESEASRLAWQRVELKLLGRLLFLQLLLYKDLDLEPQQFFREQTTATGTSTSRELVKVLWKYDNLVVQYILDEVQTKLHAHLEPKRRGLMIALDEAQAAATTILTNNAGDPWHSTLVAGCRPFIHRCWQKQQLYKANGLPLFDEDDVNKILSDLVDLSGCEIPPAKHRKLPINSKVPRYRSPDSQQFDFVDKALCRPRPHPDGVHLVMDESLVVEAVEEEPKALNKAPFYVEYLDQLYRFGANPDVSSATKGSALEMLVSRSLQRFKGVRLVDPPFLQNVVLPDWCDNLQLQIDDINIASEFGYMGSVAAANLAFLAEL